MKLSLPPKKSVRATRSAQTILSAVVFFIAAWSGQTADAQIYVKNGLQIYYPFNGYTPDYSPQGNNGTGVNLDYGFDRGGNDSGSAYFNGLNAYVTSAFMPLIDVNFTVAVWFKIRSFPVSSQLWPILGIEQGVYDFTLSAGIDWTDTTLGCLFKSGGVYQTFSKSKFRPDTATWFHYCVTRQGQVQTQYINGIPTDTQQVAAGFLDGDPSTSKLTIGRIQLVALFGRGGYFNGFLDDVRLYDRAINRLEIDTLAGLIPLKTKSAQPHGLLIARGADGGISFSVQENVTEVAIFDLKGARLSTSRNVLPGRPYRFDAPPGVLVRVLDNNGRSWARLVP